MNEKYTNTNSEPYTIIENIHRKQYNISKIMEKVW